MVPQERGQHGLEDMYTQKEDQTDCQALLLQFHVDMILEPPFEDSGTSEIPGHCLSLLFCLLMITASQQECLWTHPVRLSIFP